MVDSAGWITLAFKPPIAFVPDGWKFLSDEEDYKGLTGKEIQLLDTLLRELVSFEFI